MPKRPSICRAQVPRPTLTSFFHMPDEKGANRSLPESQMQKFFGREQSSLGQRFSLQRMTCASWLMSRIRLPESKLIY